MTPFGQKLRELRRGRMLSQKEMAKALNVSAAYLSALEHGYRSAPSFEFVQRVTGYFHVIWDEAEELQRLARLSHPKVTIDTSGLQPRATELANLLALRISELTTEELDILILGLRTQNSVFNSPSLLLTSQP
jgi:transcriptional regulator with XRE-family HTH domain